MAEGGHEHDQGPAGEFVALMDTVDLIMSQQQQTNEQVQKADSDGRRG